ncbi:MAG: tellurite resistance/C4-dicarboxylate transporter family protein [Xanthomonadales bacterium]|nr:tellurite resistance/C4-dicarboxylate transporter family protein [Xanthomonadales bacterium]MCE7931058.1 C4-dicarboxylate ABC transporter [Xanthomonadales bacterium PRO6]
MSALALLRERLRSALTDLSPGYFSMVMATGILSLAAHGQGQRRLGEALFAINIAIFVVISAVAAARLWWHTRAAMADLGDHLRGPGFFTFVAACNVLGTQTLLIGGEVWVALGLWLLGLATWLFFTYTIFTLLTVKIRKPALERGINGGWLLAVVATQSLAVLGALLAVRLEQPWRIELNFFALSMWLCGGMLYIWMMSLIFYRYTFLRFSPGDLSPPYWINMGAMAISTLAGSQLLLNSAEAPLIQSLRPFIAGFTVFYWATGTWWIPMLLLLGVWRHLIRRFPLHYDPMYWGLIFPLGMYAASTEHLTRALGLDFLRFLPPPFLWLGLLGWLMLFIGQLRALWHGAREALAMNRL